MWVSMHRMSVNPAGGNRRGTLVDGADSQHTDKDVQLFLSFTNSINGYSIDLTLGATAKGQCTFHVGRHGDFAPVGNAYEDKHKKEMFVSRLASPNIES